MNKTASKQVQEELYSMEGRKLAAAWKAAMTAPLKPTDKLVMFGTGGSLDYVPGHSWENIFYNPENKQDEDETKQYDSNVQ